jgi:hypothetical protein
MVADKEEIRERERTKDFSAPRAGYQEDRWERGHEVQSQQVSLAGSDGWECTKYSRPSTVEGMTMDEKKVKRKLQRENIMEATEMTANLEEVAAGKYRRRDPAMSSYSVWTMSSQMTM